MRCQIKISLLLMTILASCSKNVLVSESEKPYLAFISHTRLETIGKVNPQLFYVDWNKYPILLIGGDLDQSTTSHDSIINRYNGVFDFSNSNTLWAVGNHDKTDQGLIDDYTQKDQSHVFIDDKIAVFTLNDINSEGVIHHDALEFLENASTSLSSGYTLIVLTHKLIWLAQNPSLSQYQEGLANGEMGTCLHCTPENGNFYRDLYPMLTKLKSKGVSVICLAGDLGKYQSYFEYETEDGIVLLANGFEKSNLDNKFLLFYDNSGNIEWESVEIESFK